MASLRQWRLSAQHPLALQIAADARLSATDYTDDQTWQVHLGSGESPALSLQTRYGGRVGLASLVPMFTLERRAIYQQQGYAQPPVITAFAPGYLRAEAKLTPRLALRADFHVVESHAVRGLFTLRNTDKQPLDLRVEIIGFVGSEGKEQRLALLPLSTGGQALLLGPAGNLLPVVVMENATADPLSTSKIGVNVTIPPNKTVVVRWVHVGLPDVNAALALAKKLIAVDWKRSVAEITRKSAATPSVETGDLDVDAAIAFSYQQLIQSFISPTGSLPYASFVGARQPGRGFSPRGDGTDHIRAWSGQTATLAYLLALGAASIDGPFAQGVLRNYLAIQREDGWIDWKPGLAGQRQGLLCLPVLARLAWGLFQYTEDETFLREVYPKLKRFVERWLQNDVDGDGLPEWQSEVQTGYPFMPTFAAGMVWGQNADISLVEAPDLAAYLLSELITLREMAFYLRDSASQAAFQSQIKALQAALERLHRNGRYGYQDRDTHQQPQSVTLLQDGAGDEEHFIALPLNPPSRVIVRVTGGMEHVPRMTLLIDGQDAAGNRIQETAQSSDFTWTHGRGVYTTRAVFANVERLRLDGLVRVYRIHAATVDLSRLDLTALLALWSVGITPERAAELIALLKTEFWRTNGVTMCAGSDPNFDPSNASGAGGVWAFWLTLIGEGLIEYGSVSEATDMLKRLLKAQIAVLRQEHSFYEFYHADEPRGLGERGSSAGIVPLHLLLRVLGLRIVSSRRLWAGGEFAWGSPVTVTQHGVVVRRSAEGTQIRFPSGNTLKLPFDAPFQEITDSR
jgi:hypothetical protein